MHWKIKDYARLADRDSDPSSAGYGKLNTKYELSIFKDMINRNGLQAELKKQVPNIKGVTVPVDKTKKNNLPETDTASEKTDSEKDLTELVNDFVKENRMVSDPNRMQDIISAKLDTMLDESEK